MDIVAWLRGLGLEHYAEAFRASEVTLEALPELTDADLRELGLPLGPRRVLLKAIRDLTGSPLAAHPGEPARAQAGPDAEAAVPGPKAERRQLTVMFVDLVGSTTLSSKLDPEDMREVISDYQNVVASEIARFEGHVSKFMGDGVLAYFGWPRAHEDDAERAVRAGLSLAEKVAGLKTPDGAPMAARIGVATGLVVVGELVGDEEARERAVVGETPNLAARLQTLAEPGAVVIGAATRRLVGGLFVLSDLGPQRLKGFAEPLAAFRVEGEGDAEGRFEALRGHRLTPLVGREHELAILLERWAWAKEGDGQMVLLSGEPGIGKSRLLRALREQLGDEPHTALSHYCSPYHNNSALYPVIGLLERSAQLERDEPPERQLAKLKALLARSSERPDEAVPLLAALLGVPAGERAAAQMLSPEEQKRQTLHALVDQLAGLAKKQPVLVLYEDVHWADPSTLELLGLVIERIRQLPVLALITLRPEFQPSWTGHAHVTQLALNRLGRRQRVAIIRRLTDGKALPDEVLDEIVAKTDGVPLFVEELAKTVLELGLLTDAGDRYVLSRPLPPLAIPATLHDSLMARLDRLAPVKEVAQVAACIGREFDYPLLAAVSPVPEPELSAALDRLVAAELVFARSEPPEGGYAFKHALVGDAAHESLLKSWRRELHARIVAALEERFEAKMEAEPEVLAQHCTEAGLVERAIDYWQRAGERSIKRSANPEAVAHFHRALDMLEALPDREARAEQELRLLLAFGPALTMTRSSGAPEIGRVYARARELARVTDRSAELFPTVWGSWLVAFSQGDVPTTSRLVDELFDVARGQDDPGLMLQAHHAAWAVARTRGDFGAVWHHAEAGLSFYRRDAHCHHAHMYIGHDPGVCGYMYGALARLVSGYPDQAVGLLEQGLTLARDLAHPPTLVHALWFAAELRQVRREPEIVDELATALAPLASEHGSAVSVANATMLRGWARAGRGRIEEGLAELREGLAAWRATGSRLNFSSRLVPVADVYWMAGRAEDGLALIAEAAEAAERSGDRWFDAELHRLRGDLLLLAGGAREEADASYQRAVAVAQGQGARLLELRAATCLARLWRDQGRRSEACGLLTPLYGWFAEGFDIQDLRVARALLDELGSPPS